MPRTYEHSSTQTAPGSVILLSGGIESSTLLHLEHPNYRLLPMFVDYRQRAATRERAAARSQCEDLGLALKELDLSAVGESFREGQERRLHVPIPHRNLTILSLGLSYAAQCDAKRLSIALNREDSTAYASAGSEFLASFRAIAAALGGIEVAAPLFELSKAEVIRRGSAVGVDYARTYSCLLGYEQQCGACPQCEKRRAAFTIQGLEDPAGFKRGAN